MNRPGRYPMDESELLRRLDRLADVQPAPDATDRAVARARCALTPAVPHPNRRLSKITRYSAVAAALADDSAVRHFLLAPPTSTGACARSARTRSHGSRPRTSTAARPRSSLPR